MIQTKVSKEAHYRLKQIEHKKGLTSYGIIQMMCDNPLQYPCLENPMDGGAWCRRSLVQATVHGVAKSRT